MTTKTAQFTPGPWVAALGEHLNTDVYHLNKQGNRVFVAEFATQADAVLGATAPAMYEALKAIMDCVDLDNKHHHYGTALRKGYEQAKAALAQAEGR